ncbi:hypothetical protein SAY86_015098 [Trapa natans]|uniref:Uncharacterized protein n=1 Tax=Trapa natans TaxID=22666 RepID=A0AAN7KME8_TRANT|nr:hypothetical protein SAY86_015098 [Trapa natans]
MLLWLMGSPQTSPTDPKLQSFTALPFLRLNLPACAAIQEANFMKIRDPTTMLLALASSTGYAAIEALFSGCGREPKSSSASNEIETEDVENLSSPAEVRINL